MQYRIYIPKDKAIESIKKAIKKTYGSKGDKIVQMNYDSVDKTLENLFEVKIPNEADKQNPVTATVSDKAPDFVKNVLPRIIEGKGDSLPVSAFPKDGTFPTATAMWEKRNIALEIPVWDADICIQCNKCVMVCPHATIRAKIYDEKLLENAPKSFKSVKFKGKEFGEGLAYSLQVAPEDCTGCGLCIDVCPVKEQKETRLKAINMAPQIPIREQEKENWDFFLSLPEIDRIKLTIRL